MPRPAARDVVELRLTPQQQDELYQSTGTKRQSLMLSVRDLIMRALAAASAGSAALPMTSSMATLHSMLHARAEQWPNNAPPIVALALSAEQQALIQQITQQQMTSILCAPDEWKVVYREKWNPHVSPLRIGKRILVVPADCPYAARATDVVVKLPATTATATNVFGTGQHAATQLCLLLLETHLRPHEQVFDVGTGSGILAVAAARLGAGVVLAVDIDPQAVETAHRTVATNELHEVIHVRPGGVDAAETAYDVVVANLLASVIIDIAAGLAQAVRPGGVLITSGIIAARTMHVCTALEAVGFVIEEQRAQNGWQALVCRRL